MFDDCYASVILGRPGHHVVGCVLTCEMSNETVIGKSCWGEIKETAVDFEKNKAIQTQVKNDKGKDGLLRLCALINAQEDQENLEPLKR